MSGKVDLVLTDIAMRIWMVMSCSGGSRIMMPYPGDHDDGVCYDPNHVLVRAKVDGLKDVLFKPFDVESWLN